jgi:hypothetical protein
MAIKRSFDIRNFEWKPIIGVVLVLAVIAALAFLVLSQPKQADAELNLSAEMKQAYHEAQELAAVYGNYEAAIERLNLELQEIPSINPTANDLYTRAKLTIYQADIYLTYGLDYARGFALLGVVLEGGGFNNLVRSEALMLAMAHAFQGLDEGALTITEVRDYIFLSDKYSKILGIGLADAMLLDETVEVYPYLARGFNAAVSITDSEKIRTLSESYSLRLSAPFVIPPPTGGYYYSFIASAGRLESKLDAITADYAANGVPYQEFVATAYYNLARAYEALPQGEVNIVENMSRVHGKLTAYLDRYANTAFGARSYLLGIDTHIVCRAVDDANFEAKNIDALGLQPHLDELIAHEGWVVPCAEAFKVIADKIDTRFAEYF